MEKRFAIGMDIGGSHITAAIIDLNDMKVVEGSVSKVSFDSNLPVKVVMDFWENAIRSLCEKTQVEKLSGIAMAIPGPFDYGNGTCWIKDQNKYDNFYGLNIKDLLRERFDFNQDFPIVFENDAISFGKGEVYKNTENLSKKVMAITLGTGLGSCFIENGKIVNSGEKVPRSGEIWDHPYQNGIAEDSISLRGLLSNYHDLSDIQLNKGIELYHLANDGDEKAIKSFNKFGEDLAEVVIPWLKSFNADMLVIGGKLANAGDLFLNVFREKAKNAGIEIELVISSDNETAALLGVATLLYEVNVQ
ncbi:ROK family protein [Flavobacterium granuli]|uniref:Glucokinase n=1 Tax=Flavobacterium granuli TaxID=280093 RepID=A0ABU1S0Z3_9FLAO|nr:ROK family protein [Flavobacterium granuli]MDR6844705.1 glucokinase [Flavobacterium granuli]